MQNFRSWKRLSACRLVVLAVTTLVALAGILGWAAHRRRARHEGGEQVVTRMRSNRIRMRERSQSREGQRIDPAALLGVALAGAVTMTLGEGEWELWSSFIGLTLLLVLHAYHGIPRRRSAQSAAFGAVWGLCFNLVIGVVLEVMFDLGPYEQRRLAFSLGCTGGDSPIRGCAHFHWVDITGFVVWLLATVLFWMFYGTRR